MLPTLWRRFQTSCHSTIEVQTIEDGVTVYCAPQEVTTDSNMTLCQTRTSRLTGGC